MLEHYVSVKLLTQKMPAEEGIPEYIQCLQTEKSVHKSKKLPITKRSP